MNNLKEETGQKKTKVLQRKVVTLEIKSEGNINGVNEEIAAHGNVDLAAMSAQCMTTGTPLR